VLRRRAIVQDGTIQKAVDAHLGYQFRTEGIKKDFAFTSTFAVAINYVKFAFLAAMFLWLLK
jgi:hypothetical protein